MKTNSETINKPTPKEIMEQRIENTKKYIEELEDKASNAYDEWKKFDDSEPGKANKDMPEYKKYMEFKNDIDSAKDTLQKLKDTYDRANKFTIGEPEIIETEMIKDDRSYHKENEQSPDIYIGYKPLTEILNNIEDVNLLSTSNTNTLKEYIDKLKESPEMGAFPKNLSQKLLESIGMTTDTENKLRNLSVFADRRVFLVDKMKINNIELPYPPEKIKDLPDGMFAEYKQYDYGIIYNNPDGTSRIEGVYINEVKTNELGYPDITTKENAKSMNFETVSKFTPEIEDNKQMTIYDFLDKG